MRHRAPGRGGDASNAAWDYAEHRDVVLFAVLEHQLHTEADAEHRLSQRGDHVAQTELVDPRHRKARRADAGDEDAPRAAQRVGIGGSHGIATKPFERERDRGDVAIAEVEDRQIGGGRARFGAHNTPFVLGTLCPSPSARTAWRSARPNAL